MLYDSKHGHLLPALTFRIKRRPSFLLSVAVAALGLVIATACVKTAGEPSGAVIATQAETDLPAGINDAFLDEELDVETFVERFEGESRAVYAKRVEIAEALDLIPGDAVADIGAGTGFFSFLFAESVGETGQVYAVEISPRFLDHLRTESTSRGLNAVAVVEATEKSVSLPPASIDLAFICDVYHHFAYPESSLASLRRALKPGGSLVLIDFHRIPGESPEWLLKHMRAGREVFQSEIEDAGFELVQEIKIEGLEDNYFLRFDRTD